MSEWCVCSVCMVCTACVCITFHMCLKTWHSLMYNFSLAMLYRGLQTPPQGNIRR